MITTTIIRVIVAYTKKYLHRFVAEVILEALSRDEFELVESL